MSFFGYVFINGSPKYSGPVTIGGAVNATALYASADVRAGGSNGIFWNGRTIMTSTADGTVAFVNAAQSTGATLIAKSVNFNQPASTYAQTALILNGPRAASPIAWVEVQVNNSTGRIPVW